MTRTALALLCLMGAVALFSGCERNDYQHPLHRSTK